jgi:hypothetical protein
VRRDGRHFSYRLLAEARSPRFATPIGFTPRADVLIAEQLVSYRFRPEGRRLLTWGPDILVRRVWDAGGRLLDRSTGPAVHWAWARQTSFGAYYLATAETLTPADAPALAGDTVFPGHRRGVLFSTQAFRAVNVSGQYESGTRANTTPPDGRAPAPAQFAFADLSVTVRPAAAHTVQLTYLLTRLADATTAAPLFDGHVSRLRWNWQITRPLSLRVILHYDGVGADPARTRVEASRTLNADVLVTWFAHPGTALYVGYNTNARYLATLPGRSPGFETDARRFFAKASYRIRF